VAEFITLIVTVFWIGAIMKGRGIFMKKLIAITITLAVVTVGIALAIPHFALADNDHPDDIVGVWEVDAAAPYRPHLFSFHADGTMTTTNPTNVQENPAAPHGGTNDSLGMGVWKVQKHGNDRFVVGTFEQLNAFVDNRQPTDKLSVSFKVKLSSNGQHFDGPASAAVGADTLPSHVTGDRVNINYNAINGL
jgi:hypothetical protein